MLKIEIDTAAVRELKGTSKTTGKPYHLRIQQAYAFIVDDKGNPAKYPEKFEVSLSEDQTPFPPGFYTLHPSAISVREGRLSISPRFAPAK